MGNETTQNSGAIGKTEKHKITNNDLAYAPEHNFVFLCHETWFCLLPAHLHNSAREPQ